MSPAGWRPVLTRRRIELTVPSWEPALIEAVTASQFTPTHESYSMGMKP